MKKGSKNKILLFITLILTLLILISHATEVKSYTEEDELNPLRRTIYLQVGDSIQLDDTIQLNGQWIAIPDFKYETQDNNIVTVSEDGTTTATRIRKYCNIN